MANNQSFITLNYRKMEALESAHALTSLPPATDSDPTPPSSAIDGALEPEDVEEDVEQEHVEDALEQEDVEDLDTSNGSLAPSKDVIIIEDGLPVLVTMTASMPTSPGFYTDVMLANAALNPQASTQLKQLCLSAQNARTNNEIPRQRVKDYWDHLLEEACTFRKDMVEERQYFIELAKDVANIAKFGWKQRQQRRKGSIKAWKLFRGRIALRERWTERETKEDAKRLARLAYAQHLRREKRSAA